MSELIIFLYLKYQHTTDKKKYVINNTLKTQIKEV